MRVVSEASCKTRLVSQNVDEIDSVEIICHVNHTSHQSAPIISCRPDTPGPVVHMNLGTARRLLFTKTIPRTAVADGDVYSCEARFVVSRNVSDDDMHHVVRADVDVDLWTSPHVNLWSLYLKSIQNMQCYLHRLSSDARNIDLPNLKTVAKLKIDSPNRCAMLASIKRRHKL